MNRICENYETSWHTTNCVNVLPQRIFTEGQIHSDSSYQLQDEGFFMAPPPWPWQRLQTYRFQPSRPQHAQGIAWRITSHFGPGRTFAALQPRFPDAPARCHTTGQITLFQELPNSILGRGPCQMKPWDSPSSQNAAGCCWCSSQKNKVDIPKKVSLQWANSCWQTLHMVGIRFLRFITIFPINRQQ